MKVTVYYDYICPFCFLGIKRLEALEKEYPMEIESKGIEIHPEIPPQGVKRAKTLKLNRIVQNIAEISGEDGFKIELPEIIANSRLSLEASEFAKNMNRFKEFHNGIYEAYFLRGENIGNRDAILGVGEKVGLPIKELEECLEHRTMLKRIEENRRDAEKSLVLGVPTFIFGDFPIHGVQSLDSLRRIIDRVLKRS